MYCLERILHMCGADVPDQMLPADHDPDELLGISLYLRGLGYVCIGDEMCTRYVPCRIDREV